MLPTKEQFLELYNRKFGKSAKIQDVQLDAFTMDNLNNNNSDMYNGMDGHAYPYNIDSNNSHVYDRDYFGFIIPSGSITFSVRMYGKHCIDIADEQMIPQFFNEYVQSAGKKVAFSFYGYSVTRY